MAYHGYCASCNPLQMASLAMHDGIPSIASFRAWWHSIHHIILCMQDEDAALAAAIAASLEDKPPTQQASSSVIQLSHDNNSRGQPSMAAAEFSGGRAVTNAAPAGMGMWLLAYVLMR